MDITHNQGRHEQASRDGHSCTHTHQDEVHHNKQCQAALCEVCHVGLSGVMAHAEELDDGVVAAGQEEGCQVIVLTLLTPDSNS